MSTSPFLSLQESQAQRFVRIRDVMVSMASPLSDADASAQSMPDASPSKWHLAHTSWFFEEFFIAPALGDEARFNPAFSYLFNSYYDAVGDRHARDARGLLTRPSLSEVLTYRAHVDAHMVDLINSNNVDSDLLALGLAHEEQHQELFYTDLLHLFAQNPLKPTYQPKTVLHKEAPGPLTWTDFTESISQIGHSQNGFAFDCESPRHRAIVPACALADRAATNGEWMQFIEDGGYSRPELWLSDGFAAARNENWKAPLYWHYTDNHEWWTMTLSGPQQVDPSAPVTHISFYEADAFATYSGARLPTEQEWERAAASKNVSNRENSNKSLAPQPQTGTGLRGLYSDAWEWTSSAFSPYPGFKPSPGAIGEYNGKFMSGQRVLRGGSCVTSADHTRATYRNFFHPDKRWQFSGVRLARDIT